MKTLKANELRPCDGCSGPIAPLFYRVMIARTGVKLRDIQRTLGLAQYLGGNLALAQRMGPDPDATQEIGEPVELFLCSNCACMPNSLALFMEARSAAAKEKP